MAMTWAFILFLESDLYVDVGQLMHILFLKGILYTTGHGQTSIMLALSFPQNFIENK